MLEQIIEVLKSANPLYYEQFTIDWIEDKRDALVFHAPPAESDQQIMTEALSYEVDNILKIMRSDIQDRVFFVALQQILSRPAPTAPKFIAEM